MNPAIRRERCHHGLSKKPRWHLSLQAEAAALPLSNHTFVEPSAYVMAVAPTASWFEYLDMAGAVLTERLLPVDSMVTGRGPGLGLDGDEDAVARYAFS
jgi:mandelate racemase